MGTEIAQAEVIPYALRFANPYLTARGELERREIVLLRLRSVDGLEGLGEAVALTLRGSGTPQAVAGELQDWAQSDRAAVASLTPPARCAVETAQLDLEARAADVPLWRLLGAEVAEPVECNATLPAGNPDRISGLALDWAGDGFRTFKLKVGLEGDVEQVAGVRRTVGDAACLRIDANGVWNVGLAAEALGAMAESDLEFVEQPCESLEQMAAVRAETGARIAADESVTSPGDARAAVAKGACDLATAKLSKVGGPRAALAVAAEVPVYLSSALDGPVGIAAAAHTAQALRGNGDAGVAHGLATQRLFAETIASRECELRDGFLHLPDGPGLGVEIDDAALERHRL